MDINDKENKLFEKWKNEFNLNGDLGFCCDGLIFNGKCTKNGGFWNAESGNQEELWNNAKRKILFFMKEPNKNSDNDYREWGLEGNTSHTFFKIIYSWLNGLTKINANDEQPLPITNTFPKELPLVIVNAKKASGGSTADDNLVYLHADKYKALLREQLDIYSPNIIVCGGGYTCKTKEILMHYVVNHLIYNDIEFTKMEDSNWIWYSVERKMVLINSYHPTSRVSDEEKYETLIKHFQKFLKLNLFEIQNIL